MGAEGGAGSRANKKNKDADHKRLRSGGETDTLAGRGPGAWEPELSPAGQQTGQETALQLILKRSRFSRWTTWEQAPRLKSCPKIAGAKERKGIWIISSIAEVRTSWSIWQL